VSAASKHTSLALASIAAAAALSVLAGSAGGAWSNGKRDRQPPSMPTNVSVVSATPSSVTLSWDGSTDNVGVAGYDVYVNAIRGRVSGTRYIAEGLECGSSVSVQVAAYDKVQNRSERAEAIVSTAACPDLTAPTPPDGFRQEATTRTAVVLAWDASTDNVGVVSYGVYDNALPLSFSPTPSVALSGLSCGTTHRFDVDAADAAGNRSPRRAAWVTTSDCSDAEPPTTPGDLAVTGRSATSLTLTWSPSTDDVGVAGYRVTLGGATVADVDKTTAIVSGLTCSTTYSLAVSAYDAAGGRSTAATITGETDTCAAPSDPPSTPPSDAAAPSQPTSPAVTAATRGSISLAWAPSTDNVGVAGYGVYLSGSEIKTTPLPEATITGLACGSAYTFSLDAFDAAGNRSPRTSVTATTSACADVQAPTSPSNVTATSRTATGIALSWSPSSDNVGVAGYGLYRGSTLVGTSTGTTGIFSGLNCNTNYTLAVDAVDASANRSGKTTVMVSTTACADTTPPSAPTGLAASNVSETGLTLGWNASTDNVGVNAYDVYRNGTHLTSVTSTSSAQTGLACGNAYTFAVEARDAAGNRSARTSAQLSTASCPPAPAPAPAPSPPSTGTAIDSFSDLSGGFQPSWVNPVVPGGSGGGGLWEIATPLGPGFKFVATDQMPAPWDSSTKLSYAQKRYDVSPVGQYEVWDFEMLFPSSGNASGWPQSWSSGVLWEWHTATASGQHVAVDPGSGRFRVGIHKGQAGYEFVSGPPIPLDRWVPCKIEVKWSSSSDGVLRVTIDGQQVTNYSGPTLIPGEVPYLQFGWYGARQLRNEVWFAGIRKS
jgi:chitodextrinase